MSRNALTRDKLGYFTADPDGRLPDSKELVDKGTNDNQNDTDEPDPDRKAGHSRIVGIGHNGADLGVGRVLGDENRFQLHLADEVGVLVWLGLDFGGEEEGLHALKDVRGKVGIIAVQLVHLVEDLAR